MKKMSEYIGVVGSRISVEAVYKKAYEYRTHYTYYGESHSIHVFEDAEGNCIAWNTTGIVSDRKCVNARGDEQTIYYGSKVLITATVKAHSEYKGTKQTTISRPRFKVIELGKSPEEIQREKEAAQEQKRKEQLESLSGKDFIWEMPYKQYKEHYSDCETVIDSYDDKTDNRGFRHGHPTIKVIIREGRLKNSGVRGKHFHGFEFRSVEPDPKSGKPFAITVRAVSEENARKQLAKDPETKVYTWELYTIYR